MQTQGLILVAALTLAPFAAQAQSIRLLRDASVFPAGAGPRGLDAPEGRPPGARRGPSRAVA